MNTAILLGAGSALAADFPSTQNLTDLVLSGHGVTRLSDTSYYTGGDEQPAGTALLANSMVRRLYAEAERYYAAHAERRSNYEDLFYLALQALDDLRGEMENPAVRAFVHDLDADMSPLIEAAKNTDCDELHYLLSETVNYIADIVWRSLCREPACVRQLDVIAHVCNSVNVTSIATLCHDTHVEGFLMDTGIVLSDGFSEPQAGVRYWNGDFSLSGAIPFLKLHGSVNWFRLCPDSSDWHDERIGIPVGGDYQHTQTESGDLQTAIGGRPMLLVGTFNKIVEYSSGIFRELHHRFRTTIGKADQIVVCGYGFGDKGINAEIIEWYYDKRGRRLVIIHPDPDRLVGNARAAIRCKWPKWQEDGSILMVRKRFEDLDSIEFVKSITAQ